MPKFEFRFDLAAILLASVLTALGFSTAEAARAGGGHGGEFRSGFAAASGELHSGTGSESPSREGGKCCINGGDVRSR